MKTRAYVFIKVGVSKTGEIVGSLAKIEGIKTVHPCWGLPDIIAFVEVPDTKALTDLVLSKIQSLKGVVETDTHIVIET
ncbi:MAG TPA: Lrp/AsnC ligand binding domain-containing protein [Candidatus Brocadiales bacterium]|jgi:DNA-binding Lrp family transcriptional regulator|nr:Lrp/AsnC ligand binding domain-containing protein [Nitrospirota bacterium]HLG30612.1 Lrp/AsnC ligand binding domain-containing protein [Candidatus Brocadiales bacterium]